MTLDGIFTCRKSICVNRKSSPTYETAQLFLYKHVILAHSLDPPGSPPVSGSRFATCRAGAATSNDARWELEQANVPPNCAGISTPPAA